MWARVTMTSHGSGNPSNNEQLTTGRGRSRVLIEKCVSEDGHQQLVATHSQPDSQAGEKNDGVASSCERSDKDDVRRH